MNEIRAFVTYNDPHISIEILAPSYSIASTVVGKNVEDFVKALIGGNTKPILEALDGREIPLITGGTDAKNIQLAFGDNSKVRLQMSRDNWAFVKMQLLAQTLQQVPITISVGQPTQ